MNEESIPWRLTPAMARQDIDMWLGLTNRLRAVHVLRLSSAGIVQACNAAAAHNLGVPPSALVGRSCAEVFTEADAKRLERELRVPGSRDEPLLLNFCDAQHVPYTLVCHLDVDADGATLVAEPSLEHDRRDQRRLLDIAQELAVLVRERAQVEHALRVSQQALVERERELEQHAAALDARNAQLRRLASELVLADQRAREEVAKTLHDELQQLIFGAMLKLDRLAKRASGPTAEAEIIARTRADLEESVRAVRSLSLDLFSPVLHEGGLPAALAWLAARIHAKYGVTVSVSADPRANPERRDVRTLLLESVRELLFNAVKHAQVGRVDVELTLEPDGAVQIVVRDEGVGFDPGVVLDVARRQGPGLGLFSVRERVVLLGGRFDVQSRPGAGARFTLVTSRADGALEGPSQPNGRLAQAETGREPRTADGPLRILIVDDHPIVRAGLRELFAEHPDLLAIGEAADGVDAIASADALQPDVIVMDVSMPGMDGIAATRRIRAAHPHIQIVGLSSHDHEDGVRRMLEAGAVAYFSKAEGAERLLGFLMAEHAARRS